MIFIARLEASVESGTRSLSPEIVLQIPFLTRQLEDGLPTDLGIFFSREQTRAIFSMQRAARCIGPAR